MRFNINKYHLLLFFFSLSLILLSTYHILGLYFWHDDYTHLYKAQNGILSLFPYRIFSFLTPILYSFFGLNPFWYHFLGILLYFLSSLFLFKLLALFFKDNKLALIGTLVFSSGYLGQGSLIMFIGDGVGTLPVLPLVILIFIVYLLYFKSKSSFYLVLTYILTALVLYIAPHRYAGLIVPLMLLDWINWFDGRRINRVLGVIFRSALSIFIFYFFYSSGTSFRLGINSFLTLDNFLMQIGNFWNFIFPSFIQENLFGFRNLFVTSLPVYFIFGWISLSSQNKDRKFWIKIVSILIVLVLGNFFIYDLVINSVKDNIIRPEIINGFLIVILIVSLLITRIRGKLLFLSCAFVGTLSIFFVFSVGERIDSSYRYLMAYSFVLPIFLLSIFVDPKRKYKRIVDYIFVTVPLLIIVVFRLISAINTQVAFNNDYSHHFKNIYSDLYKELPIINNPTLIYMEGTTKDLDFVVGDASRVGELPTQAAFATHYKTLMSNIIWPETIDDIGKLVIQNKLKTAAVHTFIYDGNKLIDTSARTKDMLTYPNKYSKSLIINRYSTTPFTLFSEENDGNPLLYSSVPLYMTLYITNFESQSVNLDFQWKYDSYGPLDTSRLFDFKLLKGESKKIKFKISAGGTFLKELRIVSLDVKNANIRVGSLLISASID